MKRFLMKPEGDGGSAGGTGSGEGKPAEGDKPIVLTKEQFDALMAKVNASAGSPPPKPDDESLADKVRKENEKKERQQQDSKQLESALRFTMQAPTFVKDNAGLLPKGMDAIFAAADKQTDWSNEVEKANAIKTSVATEFFAQQANVDLLTASQKIALEDFKKLTKNDKQERVQGFWEQVFEPTLEQLRRIRRAEQVSKGLGNPSNAESAHVEKMKAISNKHYRKKRTK